jgi:ABC-type dipeptide/oligopeptide/nickel transport system permease component
MAVEVSMRAFAIFSRTARIFLIATIGCFVAFRLLQLAPGDCATMLAGGDRESAETIRRAMGGDSFLDWLLRAVSGDLGASACFRQGQPVDSLLLPAALQSAAIVGMALVMVMICSSALALLWSSPRFRLLRGLSRTGTYLLSAMPVFLLAFWSIHLVNSATAKVIDAELIQSPGWFPLPIDRGSMRFLLAAFTLAIGGGSLMDGARAITAEIERMAKAEFIIFSRAAGHAMWKHVAPSLIAPLSAVTINRLLALFGGAVVVEMLFGIQGLGYLTWAAALSRDVALLVGACGMWALAFALVRVLGETVSLLAHPKGAEEALRS